MILGHGRVYFTIATNSAKEFDGKGEMVKIFISGLIIGAPMLALLHC